MFDFDFNAYSTPLAAGFFQGLLYAVLFWVRAWRSERLSDALFGALLFTLIFEIWEYMLGFGGVEILWKELDFFPRNFSFLIPPLAYFYLKSQLNADFKLRWADLSHGALFLAFIIYRISVFIFGPEFVADWKTNVEARFQLPIVQILIMYAQQIYYFVKAYRMYQEYQSWAPTQFSDTEAVSFTWFRNFMIAFLLSGVVGMAMTLIDLWLQLDFWHDWWDELFQAALIYYLSITGYAQVQSTSLHFDTQKPPEHKAAEQMDFGNLKLRLMQAMQEDRVYLDPEISLPELAKRLKTNTSLLSALINSEYNQNFNDFINAHRVEAVKKMLQDPAAQHLSLLGIGLDCGFNSKSTFNRAFKKFTGKSPGAFE